jgi:hypothetical protein
MSKPFITALSHSGGVQSHALLEMVVRGDIEKPFRFVVLNSDPGMEDSRTYELIRRAREMCRGAGIDYITAPGPNLYHDIVNSVSTGQRRIDNPPYWTAKIQGASKIPLPEMYEFIENLRSTSGIEPIIGKLKQKCTGLYKIAAMDRAMRAYMGQKYSVSDVTKRLRPGLVEKWIGFAADEWHRCSESDTKYIKLRYPLIELGYDKAKVIGYYIKNGINIGPRSVCASCFSNGLDFYSEMHANRPNDWSKAVEVDNAVEKWHLLGITEFPVFVSRSLIRLRDMPERGFGIDDPALENQHCNSGACFI